MFLKSVVHFLEFPMFPETRKIKLAISIETIHQVYNVCMVISDAFLKRPDSYFRDDLAKENSSFESSFSYERILRGRHDC